MAETLTVIGAVAFFVSVWCLAMILVASFGPWGKLARIYPATSTPTGAVLRFQSAKFNLANYGACLTIRLGAEGIHFAVLPPFRIGHSPLLIPWPELRNIKEKRMLWARFVTFEVGEPAVAKIMVSPQVLEKAGELEIFGG